MTARPTPAGDSGTLSSPPDDGSAGRGARGPRTLGRVMPMIRRKGLPTCLIVPGAGGGLRPYVPLGSFLSEWFDVFMVRTLGLLPDEEPEDSIAVTADEVVDDLLAAGRVPALLVGWSMGGVIGWEVATRLAARGHIPDLVLIDTSPLRRAPHPETDETILAHLVTMLGPNPGPEARDRLRRVFQAQVVALSGHQLSDSYPGRVLLLLCSDANREAHRDQWVDVYTSLATQLRTDRLDAGHFEVFDPPHFPDLAKHLRGFVPATARNGGNR